MDIRGVEITNQLRSAIQAKLLELGVRYDEELPDYILVMVVNKKSRQHMHEDLFLFLEDSTQPFVDWLHDQVLKKLQKVTITKKKNEKEFTPITNIKEEMIKKEEPLDNNLAAKIKKDKDNEFDQLVGDLELLNEENVDSQDFAKETCDPEENKTPASEHSLDSEIITSTISKADSLDKISELNKLNENNEHLSAEEEPSTTPKRIWSTILPPELSESPSKEIKKSDGKKIIPLKRSSNAFRKSKTPDKQDPKKLKLNESIKTKETNSTISNKPKISSVVTIKSRLGLFAPSNKQEDQDKTATDKFSPSKKINSENNKITRTDNIIKLNKNNESNIDQIKIDKYKNIQGIQITSSRNKERLVKIGSVKSRLGIISHKSDDDEPKISSNTRKIIKISNVKSRLGKKIEPTHSDDFIDEDILEDIDDDLDAVSLTTSLKSKIIALKKADTVKNLKQKILLKNKRAEIMSDSETSDEDEDMQDQGKLSSKVIVTPRPLKPLQPSQKRATQSLLLKAVAEANKSVVTQRKIDPCLQDKKGIASIKKSKSWESGKKLSVNLSAKQKLADNLEKIKIELKNPNASRRKRRSPTPQLDDNNEDEDDHYSNDDEDVEDDNEDDDEQMKFVKSLFDRNNRTNPKFLVTLNGYNNNVAKKKEISSDEDENQKIKDNYKYEKNTELVLPKTQKIQSKSYSWIEEKSKPEIKKNNRDLKYFYLKQKIDALKKQNSENEDDSSLTKRRKITPIIYTRSRSPSPESNIINSLESTVVNTSVENKPLSSVVSTLEDKSGEKCRFWPNCTSGISCSYYHPEVPCSSFPACVFGDKCAYVHPKCKFGSACTKVGCIFSHPPLQCKYHPFCMKPGCPFSHPKTISSQAILEMTSQRSKFTWKKQD